MDGILAVLELAGSGRGRTLREFLSLADTFIHGTTRAINAVVTGTTARTAFLVTAGHPDILLIREGGRTDPFNYRVPYPQPYVPRSLTFEVPERVGAAGEIVAPLDESAVHRIADALKDKKVEAVAVCFLWSIVNPVHEVRTGALLKALLPGVALTLSHQLNPTLREYRRASSCCIDASLKPVMSAYLHALRRRLKESNLAGRAFAVTSQGGISDISAMAERPILSLNSGPSMAPVAGRHYARHAGGSTAIVTDAGGTTFDVSLVRNGAIPWTRETWIGPVYQGHMPGFPSVDVKSVGGGGGPAGLNGVAIARRLRCQTVVFPDAGAALSAAGAVMSELRAEAAHTEFMRTTQFDCERGNRILARLKQGAQAGSAANFADGKASRVDYAIEGRYPSQVWEIEVPLRGGTFAGAHDVRQLVKDFHARHLELFGFADDGDEIEIVAWRAVCRTEVADFADACRVKALPRTTAAQRRSMAFRDTGRIEAPSYNLENLRPGDPVLGPAIVESSFTTIVIHPGARAQRANGAFVVNVRPSPILRDAPFGRSS